MTMLFRTVGDAIKDTLNTAAAGRYKVIGYQNQTKSAEEISNLRIVQVYYQGGDFPKSGGSINGPVKHNATYVIELTVAVPAQADLTVLGDAGATALQVSAALAGVKASSDLADQNMDEFIDVIFQVLMDARNQDFDQADPTLRFKVASRWINSTRKGSPDQRGGLLTLTAEMNLDLSIQEDVVGEVGLPLEDIDTTMLTDGDTTEQLGLTVTTP